MTAVSAVSSFDKELTELGGLLYELDQKMITVENPKLCTLARKYSDEVMSWTFSSTEAELPTVAKCKLTFQNCVSQIFDLHTDDKKIAALKALLVRVAKREIGATDPWLNWLADQYGERIRSMDVRPADFFRRIDASPEIITLRKKFPIMFPR